MQQKFVNMCLYPKLIINRKYSGTRKNGGNPPPLLDERVKYVPIACGNCIECRKAKANEWRIRLNEEMKVQKNCYFITLTFSPTSLEELSQKYELQDVNDIAAKAVRLFLERYRRKYKKSIRHWIVTELGQTETERIHMHGILFTEKQIDNEWLKNLWSYGHTDIGEYCNQKTINYLVKYITKIDIKHKKYKAKIMCSAGLGKTYIDDFAKRKHAFKGEDTKEYYTLSNGHQLALPIYYRNKLFTEEQKELLWLQKIERDTRYVNSIKIENVMKDEEKYNYYLQVLETAQRLNTEIGFGDSGEEWKKEKYLLTLDMLKKGI